MLIDSSENYIFEFLLRWLRFEVRLYFSKIMAVRYGCKRPKKQLQLPLVLQKTPVTVVILPENTHFLCFFFQTIRFGRRKISAEIPTHDSIGSLHRCFSNFQLSMAGCHDRLFGELLHHFAVRFLLSVFTMTCVAFYSLPFF